MVKSLSEDLRWRIIYCQAEGFTQNEIAKRMYVSEATVNKVCRIFKKWGCVKDPFICRVGRRKIFTTQDMSALKSLVKDKIDWYLDELVHEMEQRTGKLVSVLTLWRSLQFCGITRKKIQKAAKERSEILRGVYLYNIGMNYTAEQLILLMNLQRMREHSPEGFIAVDIMEGSCDKERF
ncbi:unnamed protein product [Rhizophagus irregularis]|nr:unnamed protein product [Rhizophagus irregularis]